MFLFYPPVLTLVWILLSILFGWLGRRRKFGFVGHFLVTILLSPLVGFLVLLATSPRPREMTTATTNK